MTIYFKTKFDDKNRQFMVSSAEFTYDDPGIDFEAKPAFKGVKEDGIFTLHPIGNRIGEWLKSLNDEQMQYIATWSDLGISFPGNQVEFWMVER